MYAEKIRELRDEVKHHNYKITKYDQKYREVAKELAILTQEYLKVASTREGEYKIILDAEMAYKHVYFIFEDVKVKRLDKIV